MYVGHLTDWALSIYLPQGEHEVDYIFLIQKDVELEINPNEVMEIRYVTPSELKAMVRQAEVFRGDAEGIKFTPWSKAIIENFLYIWWPDLSDLDKHVELTKIHRIGRVDS